jgi:hypothetical protein
MQTQGTYFRDRFAMTAFLPSFGISVFGICALAWLMLTSPPLGDAPRTGQMGVILMPWQAGQLQAAAAFDLPIVALRWGGYLLVLDTSGQPNARAKLRELGHIVINTSQPSNCFAAEAIDA